MKTVSCLRQVTLPAKDFGGLGVLAALLLLPVGSPSEAAEVPQCPPGYTVIIGTEGDDVLIGTDGPDCIYGLGGNDLIFGLGGDDILVGGDGDDIIFGGDGNDILDGGNGNDWLLGEAGDDVLVDCSGDNRLDGGDGNDFLQTGPGNNLLLGGPGADELHVEGGLNWLDGGDRDDGDRAFGSTEDTCVNVSEQHGCESQTLGAYAETEFEDGHAFLFPDFNEPGFTVILRLRDDVVFVDNRTGMANTTGTAYVYDLGGGPGRLGEEWQFWLQLRFRGVGPDGQGPEGPKIEQPELQTRDVTDSWQYYDFVGGRMVRQDGAVITLTQSMDFPFQLGFTADGKDDLLGGSVWLAGRRQDPPPQPPAQPPPPRTIQGDYNVLVRVRGEDCSTDPAVDPNDVKKIRNLNGKAKKPKERYLCLESTGLYGEYPKDYGGDPVTDEAARARYKADYAARLLALKEDREMTDRDPFKVMAFGPQYPLWSDGLFKRRWVYLADKVGIRNIDRWLFKPGADFRQADAKAAGTRFWKEFAGKDPTDRLSYPGGTVRLGSKYDPRAETRLIEKFKDHNPPDAAENPTPADDKDRANDWTYASYIWTPDHLHSYLWEDARVKLNGSAIRGAVVTTANVDPRFPADQKPHVVPSNSDCNACHNRGGDVILGFDYLQLSDDIDASAPSQSSLPRDRRLSFFLNQLDFAERPDPRPLASPIGYRSFNNVAIKQRTALGYFHANCGHCHNPKGDSDAFAKVDFRWVQARANQPPATTGDPPMPQRFNNSNEPAVQTAITGGRELAGRPPKIVILPGGTGDPDQSLVVTRMRRRVDVDRTPSSSQMPTLATQIADVEGLAAMEGWITVLRKNDDYPE